MCLQQGQSKRNGGHSSELITIEPQLLWRSLTTIPKGASDFSKNGKLRSVCDTKIPIWSNIVPHHCFKWVEGKVRVSLPATPVSKGSGLRQSLSTNLNLFSMALWESTESYDIVLGPALDGGYVLLAIKEPHEILFRDIDWSTPAVLQQTLAAARRQTLSVCLLRPLVDIDDATSLNDQSKIFPFLRESFQSP